MTYTRFGWHAATRFWIAAAVTIIVGLAALGHSALAATPTASTATAALAHVPIYKPSTVLSGGPRSRQLRSRSGVKKIAAFYKQALSKNGWHRRYMQVSPFNASFGAHRAGEGVSVSIFKRAGGSGISIATHPE